MRKSWGSTSTPYQYFNLLSSSPKMNIDCFFQKSQVVNSLEYKLKKKKKVDHEKEKAHPTWTDWVPSSVWFMANILGTFGGF